MQKSELIEQIHAIKESEILQYEVLRQIANEDAVKVKDKSEKAEIKLRALSFTEKITQTERFLKTLDKLNKK